jgi:hypothetical protein
MGRFLAVLLFKRTSSRMYTIESIAIMQPITHHHIIINRAPPVRGKGR